MTFQKGVKFRIYPNREQHNLIDRTLGCSRLIYNQGLAMREDACKSGEAHHNTDIWRIAGPVDGAQWGMFPEWGEFHGFTAITANH